MSRSLTRILVALLTVLPLATRAHADSAAGSILDGYGLFALDGLRTRGFGSMANVAVNEGILHSQGALNATDFTVGANTVRLGDGSQCAHLFANIVTRSAAGCGPVPEHGFDSPLGTVDPSDDCGIAKPFPACGGPGVGVTHGSTLTLAAGKYGDALVEGGGQGPGTLILTGGKYEFCNLHLSRYAKLLVKGPSEIYVNGEVSFSNQTIFGPAQGTTIAPRDVKLFVNGARVRFARQANVTGKVCAPHGALFMTDASKLTGCALAQRIRTDHVTVKGACQTATPPTTTTSTSVTSTIPTTIPTTTTTEITTTITTTSSSTSSSTSTSTTSTTGTIEVSTTTTSTSTTTPTTILCGNDQLDPGEECDPGLPVTVVCEGSAGGALETACPLCRAAGTEGECTIDCSCCPTGKCASTTTSSTTLPTTTSTSTTSSSTSSTAPPQTTTTSSSSSTVTSNPPSTSSSTTSTLVTTTSTSTSSSTSSSTTTTTEGQATTTTTSLPPTRLDLTITTGTSNCGGPGLNPGPSAPFSGEVDDGTGTKIADLGLGCLYFGSGKNVAIAGGVIPTGSTTFFKVTATVGNTMTLAGATGASTSCTKGAGPGKHCAQGEAGTDTHGACASDADCLNHKGSCVLDANCFFGPPLSIPNGGTSTCVVNVIQTDATGTADIAAGTVNANLPLASRVYLTATSFDDLTTPTVTEACPRCIANKCNGGVNKNLACVTTAPGLTSVDCPPNKSQFLATLPIALNPFTTGATQLAANAGNGLFCTAVTPNTGAFGKSLVRTLKEHGGPAGDLSDRAEHLGSLASTFCIPPTGNALVDPAGGLPGPGGFSIAASLKIE